VTERTAVYRLYGEGGALLYVGAAGVPDSRFRHHARHKPWWAEVARREIEWHADRPAALRAEAQAIIAERPLYNVVVPLPDGSLRGSTIRRDLPDIARNASPPAPPDMRSFRVPDELWLPFRAAAELRGHSTSRALEDGLRMFLAKPAPVACGFSYASWTEARDWAAAHSAALGAMDRDISAATGFTAPEWLAIAAWLAATRHPADPEQQKRIITGHILGRATDEESFAAWRGRYRDSRHLSVTVQAILEGHLPLGAD
jgi:hypothetical protein